MSAYRGGGGGCGEGGRAVSQDSAAALSKGGSLDFLGGLEDLINVIFFFAVEKNRKAVCLVRIYHGRLFVFALSAAVIFSKSYTPSFPLTKDKSQMADPVYH